MSFIENIRLSFGAIRVNKLRSFLTMLGIIIGISAVITITTIGNSLQKTIETTMNSLVGSNALYTYVQPVYPETDEEWDTWEYPEMTEDDYLSYKELSAFMQAYEGKIDYVSVDCSLGNGTMQGKNKVNVTVDGALDGNLKVMRLDLIAGRDINAADNDGEKAVCVVSDLFVKYALGTDKNPIGQRVDVEIDGIGVVPAYIVGVYHYDGKVFGSVNTKTPKKDIATPVYVPVTYAMRYYAPDAMQSFSFLQMMASDDVDIPALKEEIKSYFNDTKYGEDGDFQMYVEDLESQLGQINTVLTVITLAVSVIAGISLIVGGVGVMNIMLISVMERTREIGIRKALGAKNKSIRAQFLTEAIIICLVGGGIGIIIGLLNGVLLANVASTLVESYASNMAGMFTVTVRPSIGAILVSVGFSMLTGLAFGYYPANRAAKLEPIDALRYE